MLQTPGCELALARLQVGERVRLYCSPEYAYGERGALPLIPPGSDMYFELELVSLRDLSTSHNPEEVDFLERYKELKANRQPEPSSRPASTGASPPAPSSEPQMQPPTPSTIPDADISPPSEGDMVNGVAPPGAGSPIDVSATTTEENGAAPGAAPAESLWIAQRARIEGRHVSGYTWQETDEDMEISCPLPPGTTKGQVQCQIRPRSLSVGLEGQMPLLEGALCGRVEMEGCAWSIETPTSEDVGPILQVLLLKCAPDDQLWGYVLAADRVANDDVPDDNYLREDEPNVSSLQLPGVD